MRQVSRPPPRGDSAPARVRTEAPRASVPRAGTQSFPDSIPHRVETRACPCARQARGPGDHPWCEQARLNRPKRLFPPRLSVGAEHCHRARGGVGRGQPLEESHATSGGRWSSCRAARADSVRARCSSSTAGPEANHSVRAEPIRVACEWSGSRDSARHDFAHGAQRPKAHRRLEGHSGRP